MTEPVAKHESETSAADESARLGRMREAFRKQVNAALYASATKYAASRAQQVALASGRIDDQYASDLVQGALVDTFVGVLDWNPEGATLEQHILTAIKSRSRHDRKRAAEFEMLPIDVERGDVSAIRTDAEVALAAQASNPEVLSRVTECLARLRELAAIEHFASGSETRGLRGWGVGAIESAATTI